MIQIFQEYLNQNVLVQNWFITIPALVLLYFFYHVILKVYLGILLTKIRYGDKVCTFFYPIVGPFIKNQFTHNKEDHLGHKMMVDHVVQNPKSKMLVSNHKSKVVYYLHDPELIQEFLMQKRPLYLKSGLQKMYLFLEDLFIQGISVVDGPEWKYLRQVSAPAFHFKLLSSKIDHIKRYAQVYIDEVESHRKSGSKENFDTYYNALSLTGSNLVSSLMGEEFITQNQEKYDILHEQDILVTEAIVQIAMNSPRNYFRSWFMPNKKIHDYPQWSLSESEKKLLKRIDIYSNKIDTFIRNRVDQTRLGNPSNHCDFLQFHIDELLKQEKSDDEVKRMSITLIRHQFTNMFTAGVGAPTSAMAMCLTHLAKYPEWQEKIRNEMYEKFDFDLDNEAMFQKLFNDLPLLDAFQREVFRQFCPSSGLFHYREAQADHKLGEFDIKKGQQVLVNILGNNNNPNSWENPEQFKPERWFDIKEEDGKNKIHGFAYLPFLGGIRNCIGQHFAKLEVKLTILCLLRQYKLELTDVKFQTRYNLNLRLKDGGILKYTPLKN